MKEHSLWASVYQSLLNRLEYASNVRKLVTFELLFFGSRILLAALVALLQAQLQGVVAFPWLLQYPLSLLGLLPIGAGVVIDLMSIRTFLELGGGTPAYVRPPKKLVTTGLYGYVRNPTYVGIFLASIGFAFVFDASLVLIIGVVFMVILHYRVVLPEERRLEQRFGDEYAEYKKEVPRWITKIRTKKMKV
jgi:protein-S-isoprenylcysteine O-methyltransferase Ste14